MRTSPKYPIPVLAPRLSVTKITALCRGYTLKADMPSHFFEEMLSTLDHHKQSCIAAWFDGQPKTFEALVESLRDLNHFLAYVYHTFGSRFSYSTYEALIRAWDKTMETLITLEGMKNRDALRELQKIPITIHGIAVMTFEYDGNLVTLNTEGNLIPVGYPTNPYDVYNVIRAFLSKMDQEMVLIQRDF